MMVGLTLPIVGAGVAALKSAGDMEMYAASFETMLGSADKAHKMLAQMQNFAAKTPFTFPDLAKASQTLLQFGITGKSVLPTLKNIGDIAQGNSERMQSLALAFGQVQSNGHLMGQDLLQMINAGFNPLQEISRKTGQSMSELRQQMSAGAISAQAVAEAFASASAKGGQFYGGMEKASQTLPGLISTLKDSIGIAGRSFAEILMPAVKTITSWFISLENTLSHLNDTQKKAILIIAGVAAAIGPLSFIIGGIMKAVSALIPIVTSAAAPWVLLGVAIAAVVAGAFFIVKNGWDKISEATVNLGRSISEIWNGISQGIGGIVTGFGQIIWGTMQDALARVGRLFSDFGSKLMESAKIIFNPLKWGQGGLKEIWSNGISDAMSAGFKTAGAELASNGKNLVEDSKHLIVDSWKNGTELMADAWSELLQGMKDGTIKTVDDIKGLFEKLLAAPAGTAAGLGDSMSGGLIRGNAASQIVHQVASQENVGGLVSSAGGAGVAGAGGGGLGMMSPILGDLSQKLGGFAGKIAQAATSMDPLSAALAILDPLISAVANTVGPLLNKVLEPLIGWLSILGQTVGAILTPIIQALSPLLYLWGQAMVFTYNWAIRPFANVLIGAGNLIAMAFTGVANGLISVINWILSLVGAKTIAYLQGPTSITQGMLQKIDYGSLTSAGQNYNSATGGYAGSGGGSSANYTTGANVTVNVQINTDVLLGDRQELAVWIAQEINKAEALGLV